MEQNSREELETHVSEQLEWLKDRLEWLTRLATMDRLTYKELLKLEARSAKLSKEVTSVLERLGL